MAPRPVHHPLREGRAPAPDARRELRRDARRRAIAAHPAGGARRGIVPAHAHEDGSMTTEYGLLVVVGATIASLVVRWASGGAVFELLDNILDSAGSLLGF